MKNRALLLAAVAASLALAGCPDKTEPPKPKTTPPASAPKPPEAPAAPAASSGQDAKPVAAMATAARKKRCKKGEPCEVKVSVKGCAVSLDFDPIEMSKDRKDDAIVWKIVDPGYAWSGDGIVFAKEVAAAATKQFYDKTVMGADLALKDHNTDTGKFKYTIELEDEKKTKCPPYDPTIINGVEPTAPE